MSILAAPHVMPTVEQELECLFREYYPMMYRTAFGLLRNPVEAEDVVQTVFLRLLSRRELPLDLEKYAKRYLYRAAVNRSLDIVRSRKDEQIPEGLDYIDSR